MRSSSTSTEVIAIASGKGGTGKTLIGACLSFALTQSGHRVLMIDADTATYGLSLYLLGPSGKTDVQGLREENTWRHAVRSWRQLGDGIRPAVINRDLAGESPHGVTYTALIADLGIYGDSDQIGANASFERSEFRLAVCSLLKTIRASAEYDYVIIDTRGGFSFESTDLCAVADSFLIVTDADYTSFYQDRNLVRLISSAAKEMETKPLMRGIFVNRATEGEEENFRLALQREFDIPFEETHAIPLDLEALKAYKTQACPYLAAPDSHFSYATLTAFRKILRVVTAEWEQEKSARWNALVRRVSEAIRERNESERAAEEAIVHQQTRAAELERAVAQLGGELEYARRELERAEAAHSREIDRLDRFISVKDSAGREKGPARLWKWGVIAVGASVVVLSLLSSWWLDRSSERRRYQRERMESLQMRLYDARQPPALRVDALGELYAAGMRDFPNIDLSGLSLRGVVFPEARFGHGDFRGADLSGAVLPGSYLYRANLSEAHLTQADLRGATLSEADLTQADLHGANLSEADLTQADLPGANLSEANLTQADLRAANFSDTILFDADFRGARVEGAVFGGSDWSRARFDAKQVEELEVSPVRIEEPVAN